LRENSVSEYENLDFIVTNLIPFSSGQVSKLFVDSLFILYKSYVLVVVVEIDVISNVNMSEL